MPDWVLPISCSVTHENDKVLLACKQKQQAGLGLVFFCFLPLWDGRIFIACRAFGSRAMIPLLIFTAAGLIDLKRITNHPPMCFEGLWRTGNGQLKAPGIPLLAQPDECYQIKPTTALWSLKAIIFSSLVIQDPSGTFFGCRSMCCTSVFAKYIYGLEIMKVFP